MGICHPGSQLGFVNGHGDEGQMPFWLHAGEVRRMRRGKVLYRTGWHSCHDVLLWPLMFPAGWWTQTVWLQILPQAHMRMDFGKGWMPSHAPWDWEKWCPNSSWVFIRGHSSFLNSSEFFSHDVKVLSHLCLHHLPTTAGRNMSETSLPELSLHKFTGKLWYCQLVWKLAFHGLRASWELKDIFSWQHGRPGHCAIKCHFS